MNSANNGPVWIGPTECDEKRLQRSANVQQIWNIVKPALQRENFIPSVYGMMSIALDLLREALNCYQNGAYPASCSVCRACAEATLFLATSQKPTSKLETMAIREYDIRAKRRDFLDAAISDDFLRSEYSVKVEKIWEAGDFAVHIHQRMDRSRKQFAKQIKLASDPITDSKAWSNPNESLEILTSTAQLVSNVLMKIQDKLD